MEDTKDIIIDENYCYKFDTQENRHKLYFQNKSFPLRPEKIFKFYSLSLYSLASLYDGYFYQANPKSFNDPFDCNINLIGYENNYTQNFNLDSVKRNDISNIGISCFTEEIDNPLMWGHYTSQYNGFVLEFHPHLFQGRIEKGRSHLFSPVIYLKKLKRIELEDIKLTYLATVKDSRWKYEKEWRLITISEDRTAYFNKEGVKAIYIGHRIPDEQPNIYSFLITLFENVYPNTEIYVVYPNPTELSLKFERVDEGVT